MLSAWLRAPRYARTLARRAVCSSPHACRTKVVGEKGGEGGCELARVLVYNREGSAKSIQSSPADHSCSQHQQPKPTFCIDIKSAGLLSTTTAAGDDCPLEDNPTKRNQQNISYRRGIDSSKHHEGNHGFRRFLAAYRSLGRR